MKNFVWIEKKLNGTHESLDESFNLDKTNLYFHGSFDRDIEKIDKPSIEHPFCVTQDIQYALDYADGGDESDDSTNGVVYLVTIDEDSLKIFDFEDDSDIKKLNSKWPSKILDCFSKQHKANKGKLIDPLIVCDLLINDMDYSEDDSEITKLMNTSILRRLEKFVGKKWKSIFEFRDDPSIKSGEYILRNLLLTDIKDLGFNGYKAHEQSGHSSDRCFILFDLDCMDKIFLKPIPFKDAVIAAEHIDKKFSKSDADIDYKKHDAAIKEFIRSLKKTKQSMKESMIAEDTKIYAYHCTNVDPEKIKKEGWKVGDTGFTVYNMFKDLYKKYLPQVPVFISRIDVPVWSAKSKYCLKIDITDLDLYPDFGSLPDTGACYDGDIEEFYWEGFIYGKELAKYVNSQPDMTLRAKNFSGEDSMKTLGTACVAGADLNKLKDRGIVEYVSKDEKKTSNESYEPPYTLDTIKQKYGDEVYKKLRDDPVHRFRAETGIEVIHKEPTRDEFERIVKNWDLMTPEQKKQSDEFSMKQFGKNNCDRIDSIRKEYEKEIDESFKLDTSKIYFHGSLDKSIKKLKAPSWKNPFCVTTDIAYAMDYAKTWQELGKKDVLQKTGVVYAMSINDSSMKIFDFQDNSDVEKLKGKWPTAMLEAFKSSEYGNSDPLAEITEMLLSYEWNEDRNKIKACQFLNKRLKEELGERISKKELERDPSLKYKKRFLYRNLLLKDISDLGYDGYRAAETQNESTDNSLVLINIKHIENVIPYPIPYEKAKKVLDALYERMRSGETMELDASDYSKSDALLNAYLKELKDEKKNMKESIVLEGKHWPEDYVKTAFNMIKNSELGKQSWYTDNYINQDLKSIVDEFSPLSHKNSNLGYFATIIKWFIAYAGKDKSKYQEFIERKLDGIIKTLLWLSNNPAEESKLKEQIKTKWTFEDFEKYQKSVEDQISKEQSNKLKNVKLQDKGYEIIPIDSYEELHEKFGGDKTGYKGDSKWCHTNGSSTYDSWTSNGKYNFFVLAKKDWEKIEPPDPKSTNAYDEYGTSLIAILVDVASGKLLNATLRWNHIIEPSKTVKGTSVDKAFLGWGDLAEVTGKDVEKEIKEKLKDKQEELQKEIDNANKQVNEYLENHKDKIKELDPETNFKIIQKFKDVVTEIKIPNGVTSIGYAAFDSCSNLASVTIPDSVTSIGNFAFSGCSGLTSVTIPDSVKNVGDSAFLGCSGLMSTTIPDSVTSIGRYAFSGCSGLTSLTIPDSVTSIDSAAFRYCHSLTSIEIPANVTSIGDEAFSGCYRLTSLVIPDSVTSIGDWAFFGCSGLTSVTIPGSVKSIGIYAFAGCSELTSLIIENGVESIGNSVVFDCKKLTSVSIPDSVMSIGKDALFGCSKLKTIYCSEKIWNKFRDEFPKEAERKNIKEMKKESLNEAHEIHLHRYPEKLQPMLDRIVKDNEDYKLDHAYFNKEGKFIWMRNLKGYFHVFKPVKFVKTPGMTKPFGFKDLILKDNGMLEEVDRLRFVDGNEGLKFLKDKYHLELKTIS